MGSLVSPVEMARERYKIYLHKAEPVVCYLRESDDCFLRHKRGDLKRATLVEGLKSRRAHTCAWSATDSYLVTQLQEAQ